MKCVPVELLITTFRFAFYGRETIYPYTISVSPNFGFLRRGPINQISSSHENCSKSFSDADAKTPFLSDVEKNYQKEESDRISIARSSFSKASFHTGEVPVPHGCSFTQTVFNCKPPFQLVL